MQTHRENAKWFDEQARARHQWRESVEHVAGGLHAQALKLARRGSGRPRVVDLGAGDTGLSTFPYLAADCVVHAVDSSGESLQRLKEESSPFPGELVLNQQDVERFISGSVERGETYDLVVARSFLHHVPDYLKVLRSVAKILTPTGVFLSYEDPPRYDRMSAFDGFYSKASYYGVRLFRGNYIRGLKTRWRRLTGKLDNSLPEDVVEYHIVRNGVDDETIRGLFVELGFCCEITKYFSTDNLLTKHLGRKLGVKNSFSALAYHP